ncbi:hypothetical protein E2C01_076650 [Portunus trituberculatus]|uniref:Uncharacterized protein n=1 Tax=Portunus trituberculatus TaxID=210409 RepID=A0A5B7IML2_PORTR|nr:hypothetical protein [Portunus trituberculatus]
MLGKGRDAGVFSMSQVNYLSSVERGGLMLRFEQNTQYMDPGSRGGGNTGVLAGRRQRRGSHAHDF